MDIMAGPNEFVPTPGPWEWEEATEVDYKDPERKETRVPNQFVSLNPGVIEYAGCGTHRIEIRDVDARLIAASPDLLEALKDVVNNAGTDSSEMWRRAIAAIAKAEGR